MSTLLIDELYPGVVFNQLFRIKKNVNLAHIRPWIYVQNDLIDGVFQCQVFDGATLLRTASITYEQINEAITLSYAHGFIRFDFDSLSLRIPEGQVEKEYRLEFSMQGHTFNGTNFLAICRMWDDAFYDTYGVIPNDAVEPAGFELFEYKTV